MRRAGVQEVAIRQERERFGPKIVKRLVHSAFLSERRHECYGQDMWARGVPGYSSGGGGVPAMVGHLRLFCREA